VIVNNSIIKSALLLALKYFWRKDEVRSTQIMRTSISRVFLVLCILLCCLVQQCHFLGFTTLVGMRLLGNMLGNGIGTAMTITQALGMTMMQSIMQSIFTTFAHGFSTLHTMSMALVSGVMMGIMALTGFIVFLLASKYTIP